MIIFLLINLCLAYCGLVESTEETGPPQQTLPSLETVYENPTEPTLDINNVDSSIFTTTEESKDDIRTIVHNVKDGYRVTSVVSEGADLWTTQDKEALVSCTLYLYGDTILMMLDIESEGKLSQKCYEKNGTEWHDVDDFENRLLHIKETSHTLHLKMLDLDISKTVPNGVEVYRDTWDGVHVSQFTAKYGYSIISVLDGECSLWTAGLNERCLEVWIHSTGTSSICRMDLMDKDGIIWTGYLEKNGGKWTVIDHCTYKERHKSMLKSRAIRMNPAHVDPSLRTCKSCVQDGSFCCINSICSDYNVSTISFNGQTLWESKDYACTEMTAFCKNGTHYFELNMKNGQEESTDQKLYYSLSNGECTVIDKNAYDEGRKRADDPHGNSISHRMNIAALPNPLYIKAYGTKDDDGMSTKTFIPQPGSSIKFVTQHALILWEAGEDSKARCTGATCTLVNKVPTFLKMDIEEDSKIEHKYFQMENGKDHFTEITERDYTSRFACCKECTHTEHIRRQPVPITKDSKDVKLDIRSLDRSLFNLEYSFDGKVVVNTISPKRGTIHITEVTEKGVLLWKSSSDEHAKSVMVRDDGDSPPTATIKYIKNGKESSVCSYRDGNGYWNIPVSLDLTSPDPSNIDIHEGVDSGISYKNCSPRDGQSIVTIMDNGETVWKAEGGERCTFVEYYARGGVTLLGLGISDGHSTRPKCFEKNGQEWSEISDDAFFDRYDVMVEEYPDLMAKVDGNLFTTELGNDGGVPTLKLKVKDGQSPNKLTFDNKDLWTGQQGCSCSEATFYFGSDNAPVCASFKYNNKDDKVVEGHRQFDGEKWTQAKKDDLQKKLNEIKQHSGAPLPPTSGAPQGRAPPQAAPKNATNPGPNHLVESKSAQVTRATPQGNVNPRVDFTQAQQNAQPPARQEPGQPAQSVSQTAARPGQQTHPEGTKHVAGTQHLTTPSRQPSLQGRPMNLEGRENEQPTTAKSTKATHQPTQRRA